MSPPDNEIDRGGGQVRFRPATELDLAGEYAVFVAAMEELHSRRGAAWGPAKPFDAGGRWAQLHRHLLAHDGERSFVAEEAGCIVGFTAALVRGDCWYFAALFIAPSHQGQGLGRRLLDLAWGGAYRYRATITEAIQPVSNGLYASRGLLPVVPVLGLAGTPITTPSNNELEPARPTPEALRAIDMAAYGFDRSVDHAFWARTSARATLWLSGGEPCAYSYSGGLFGIGPVAGRNAESAALALREELANHQGDEVRVDIPGSATRIVQVALQAGLRFADPGLLLLSPADQPPPTAYMVHSYWML